MDPSPASTPPSEPATTATPQSEPETTSEQTDAQAATPADSSSSGPQASTASTPDSSQPEATPTADPTEDDYDEVGGPTATDACEALDAMLAELPDKYGAGLHYLREARAAFGRYAEQEAEEEPAEDDEAE